MAPEEIFCQLGLWMVNFSFNIAPFACYLSDPDSQSSFIGIQFWSGSTQHCVQEEIVPVSVPGRKGPILVADDEFPRPETTAESLAKLRCAMTTFLFLFYVDFLWNISNGRILKNIYQW